MKKLLCWVLMLSILFCWVPVGSPKAAATAASDTSPTLAYYEKMELADITPDMKVIITMTDGETVWAMSNDNGTSSAPSAVVVTVSGSTLSTEATNLEWNIANTDGSLTIYPAGTTESWLYCSNMNNGVLIGTGEANVFTIDATSGYLMTSMTTSARYLGVYKSRPDWRCYTNTTGNTTGQTLAFYALREAGNDCAHSNTTEVPAVGATCTEAGNTAGVVCADCGVTTSGNEIIDALGHLYYTNTNTAPTCNEAGLMSYTCYFCDDSYIEEIPATGVHDFDANGVCGNCFGAYTKVELADITADMKVIITMTDGETVWAMSNDNGTSDAPDAVVVTVRGNNLCTEATHLEWNIANDNGSLTIYPAGTTESWLYCANTNNGVRVGTGEANVFSIDAASGYLMTSMTTSPRYIGVYNNSADWRCYTNTTGNTAGQTLAFYALNETATECDHTNTTDVAAVEATCTTEGSIIVTCDDCGEVINTETIAALGHSSSYVYNNDGTHDYICWICSTIEVDNEAHIYTNGICACGADSTLKFKQASVTLSSDFSINFYVRDSVLEGCTEPYVVFEKALYDNSGNITGYETVTVTDYTLGTTSDGVACHIFRFSGINSAELGSTVSATLYASRNEVLYIGATVEYSVLKYATNMLAKTTDDGLKTLLVDLLNYGAEAQNYFGYNTANPVNGDLTAEQKAYATSETPSLSTCRKMITNDGATVSFKTCTLVLENKVTINYYLNLNSYQGQVDDLYAIATYTDHAGKEWKIQIDSEDFDYREYNGAYYYVVNFSTLNAMQMRTQCTLELFSKTTDERVSNTVIYSIESYAYNMQEAGDFDLIALLDAMMKYGDSTETYFNP